MLFINLTVWHTYLYPSGPSSLYRDLSLWSILLQEVQECIAFAGSCQHESSVRYYLQFRTVDERMVYIMKKVVGISEIVLWAADKEQSLRFYRDLLGLEVISPPTLANTFLRVG